MDSETDQTSGIPADPEQVLALSEQLAGFALSIVQDPETRGVRVEEYLTVLAAAAGEAVLASSGVIDIESNPMNPGGAILGAPINIVLSGDVMSFAEVPADSAMGILIGRLVILAFSVWSNGLQEKIYIVLPSFLWHKSSPVSAGDSIKLCPTLREITPRGIQIEMRHKHIGICRR